MENLKKYFYLDPSVTFLNHGSFGATPKPVFEDYQNWQLRLEQQPVLFLGREYDQLLFDARAKLGIYLNADPQDLIYVPNATHGGRSHKSETTARTESRSTSPRSRAPAGRR